MSRSDVLEDLKYYVYRLKEIQDETAELDIELEELKEKIRDIAELIQFDEVESKTQTQRFPDGLAVSVTSREGTIKLNAQGLLDEVGPDIFLRACKVKTVDFDPTEWEEMIKEELVARNILGKYLSQNEDPKKSIKVTYDSNKES